tara:strand:+ start:1051 stop:1503 length:453 start_codon:yes stop_codon:yes gene_type:complete
MKKKYFIPLLLIGILIFPSCIKKQTVYDYTFEKIIKDDGVIEYIFWSENKMNDNMKLGYGYYPPKIYIRKGMIYAKSINHILDKIDLKEAKNDFLNKEQYFQGSKSNKFEYVNYNYYGKVLTIIRKPYGAVNMNNQRYDCIDKIILSNKN